MSLYSNKPKDAPEKNSDGKEKLPPGQLYTEKFPVMTYGVTPLVDRREWELRITGAVSEERTLSWEDLMALPQTTMTADFHCVTHWSRFDDEWRGVLFRDFFESIKDLVEPDVEHVMQHAYGGYTTNLSLEAMLQESVLIAHSFNGEPLDEDHGGPVRVFTPKRYGWKGAKWIKAFEFMKNDRPGFWEQNGYHNEGDPWNEERYW